MFTDLLKGFNFFVSKKTGETVLFYGHKVVDYFSSIEEDVLFEQLYVVEKIANDYCLKEVTDLKHIELINEALEQFDGAISQRVIKKRQNVILLEESKGKFKQITLTIENALDNSPILKQKEVELKRVSKLDMGFYELKDKGIIFVDELGKPFTLRISRSMSSYGTIFKLYHCNFDVETYGEISKASDLLDEIYLNAEDLEYQGKDCIIELKSSKEIIKFNIAWDSFTRNIYTLKQERIAI